MRRFSLFLILLLLMSACQDKQEKTKNKKETTQKVNEQKAEETIDTGVGEKISEEEVEKLKVYSFEANYDLGEQQLDGAFTFSIDSTVFEEMGDEDYNIRIGILGNESIIYDKPVLLKDLPQNKEKSELKFTIEINQPGQTHKLYGVCPIRVELADEHGYGITSILVGEVDIR